MSTGEFRATPDISASTAQFQAFAESEAERGRGPGRAASPAISRTTLLIVTAVVVLAAIVILIATVG